MTTMARPRVLGYEHHTPRLAGDVLLGTDRAVAHWTARHRRTVTRNCEPIACDVQTRVALYDMDEARSRLRDTRRQTPRET